MNSFDRYTSMFWTETEDCCAAIFYRTLSRENWNAESLLVEEDYHSWLKLDAKKREDIVRAFIISNSIKQIIGGVFLPLLNTSIGLEQITRRAVISQMESRLNGEHARLNSKMILGLNSVSVINKSLEEVRSMSSLEKVLDQAEVSFKAMVGWADVVLSGVEIEGKSSFDQLNYHIFQACALATVMLETAETLPMSLLFINMEEVKLPHMLEAMKVMSKDISIITGYLAMLAASKLNMLPNDEQVKAKRWLKNMIEFNLVQEWEEELKQSTVTIEEQALINDLMKYNVRKAAVKLGFPPVEKVKGMPPIVEKYLGVKELVQEEQITESKWGKRRKQK